MIIIRFLFLLFIYSLFTISGIAQDRPFLPIYSGMEINSDVLFQPGKYVLGQDQWQPIIVEGTNIDLNFNDAEFFGAADMSAPHEYKHIAIIIRNAKHVNIRNLRIYRFKIAILIENSSHITIENCDISYMYRPLNMDDIFHTTSQIKTNSFDDAISINSKSGAISIENSAQIKIKNNYFNSNNRSIVLDNCKEIDILNNYFQFNASYPVILKDCNSFSFWHNRLDYNFLKTNYTELLGLKYNSSTLSNILLTGVCNEFKIAFNHFTHGTSAIKMIGLHHNAIIVENTIKYMDGSAIILKGLKIQVLNNRISHCFNSIRILNGTIAKILYNEIEHCDIGLLHSDIMANNQISIKHNGISKNKIGFHLPIKNHKWTCDSIKTKIHIQHNCLLQNEAVFSVLNSPITRVFKNNSGILIQYSSLRNERSKLISRLKKNNKELKTISSNEKDVLILCLQPVPPAFTKNDEGMSVDHGLYNYNDRNSMLNANYGPYDYRYPFVIAYNRPTSSFQFLVLGPKNQNFELIQKDTHSTHDIYGQFHDTLDFKDLGKNSEIMEFKYTGHSFKNDRGTFILTNDSSKFYYSNILPESHWKLNCYKESKSDTTFYYGNILHNSDTQPIPLLFNSEPDQYNICELELSYKVTETSNFHCSANQGTRIWVNNQLLMEFTSSDTGDFPEIKTITLKPDEMPYKFKIEFTPAANLDLPKIKWTR